MEDEVYIWYHETEELKEISPNLKLFIKISSENDEIDEYGRLTYRGDELLSRYQKKRINQRLQLKKGSRVILMLRSLNSQ